MVWSTVFDVIFVLSELSRAIEQLSYLILFIFPTNKHKYLKTWKQEKLYVRMDNLPRQN